MPYRAQPLDAAGFAPAYPSHKYTGTGDIVTILAGNEIVGYLTKQGDALGWLARRGISDDADAVRQIVQEMISEGAAAKTPLIDTWASILDSIQHDAPTSGPLNTISGNKAVQAAAGIDTHPGKGNSRVLKDYWLRGEGAAKWKTWTELYHHLLKYIKDPNEAKATAAAWFKERYGFAPGDHRNK